MNKLAKSGKGFFLTHGIRTTKTEMNNLDDNFRLLSRNYYNTTSAKKLYIINGGYGFVSAIANVIPVVRRLAKQLFYLKLKEFIAHCKKNNLEINLLTYSFSTFLASELFQEKDDLEIDNWVLYGGVVNCRYRFDKMKSNINRVLNYCSLEDEVAKYAPWFFDYGHCGYYGFRYENGVKSKSKEEIREPVWLKSNGEVWAVNYHFNDTEHSRKRGWFAGHKYIWDLFSRIADE